MPMISGATPAIPQLTIRPSGAVFARSRLVTTTAAPPSTIPLAFPAVTNPSFANAGFNFARLSSGCIGPHMIILREFFDRRDFVAEAAGLPCRGGQLLTANGELVLCFARDAVFARQIFSRPRHVAATVRIEQGHHQRIFELTLAQLESPSRAANHVRRLAHRFHTAGKHDARFVELDQLRCRNDGLNARAAQPIDGQGRNFDRKTRFESDVTRTVHRVAAGLQSIAEDRMIEIAGLELRLRDRRLAGNRAKLDRR